MVAGHPQAFGSALRRGKGLGGGGVIAAHVRPELGRPKLGVALQLADCTHSDLPPTPQCRAMGPEVEKTLLYPGPKFSI